MTGCMYMQKIAKRLAEERKTLSHSAKGRKARKESTMDKCIMVLETSKNSIEMVTLVAAGGRELASQTAKDREVLMDFIMSDEYYNVIRETAEDDETAEAVIKNLRTRLNEIPNFAQFAERVAGKFASATPVDVPDEE